MGRKAALSGEGTEWKIPPSVAKQTAWGPEDAWTNLAPFRKNKPPLIWGIPETQWHSSERESEKKTRCKVSDESIIRLSSELMWPSALCERSTHSQGQTWSGWITLFAWQSCDLTLNPSSSHKAAVLIPVHSRPWERISETIPLRGQSQARDVRVSGLFKLTRLFMAAI